MKIIVISDTHGRDLWKKQVEEPADMYIFLGDYFDSFHIDGETQIENFRDIQGFQKANKDKVVLLTGNHDLSYLDQGCACSGYQNKYAYEIGQLLQPMRQSGDIQACKIIRDHIFTHAGLTKTWVEKYDINLNNLEQDINDYFKDNIDPFCFQTGDKRYGDPYGDDVFQGPMWVRPYSLMTDTVENYTQVVGHTRTKDGVEYNEDFRVYLTDCQDNNEDFLTLEL